MATQFRDAKDVKDFLAEHPEIRFIRVVYPDVLGQMRDQSIPVHRLDVLFGDGVGFDGSSVTGLREGVNESDLNFRPEPATFTALPWVYEGKAKAYPGEGKEPKNLCWREAMVFGFIYTPENEHFEGDSRYILHQTLERGRKSGLFDEMMVGPELEFFLFEGDKTPVPADKGGYHMAGHFGEVRKEVQLFFENMNWECDHHECALGQHEMDMRYGNALEMADRVMLARYAIKKIARTYGVYATFMPKPLDGQNGSGMHVHQSLWKGGGNLFFAAEEEYKLSKTAKGYIAGLLEHGPEFTIVWNQWVNSYKRIVPGYEAPTYLAWGRQNRSAYIRVPECSGDPSRTTRAELRSPDPATNPYLAFAGMLAAGVHGITGKLKFSAPVEENIFEMDAELRRKRGIRDLPPDMGEAILAFEQSELARSTYGEHIYRELIRNKRHEWAEYNRKVTDYEIEKYLPIL
jgi:glutamine synthetase